MRLLTIKEKIASAFGTPPRYLKSDDCFKSLPDIPELLTLEQKMSPRCTLRVKMLN
ncbi:hypothetical protein WN51_09510 [Melipona quadrifasciata]|uniref:Uncharacterized protein n=1 Tax=Melipona quadrifasciata TaxID=166423 RepID=A0A0N0U6K1_9HYME|nr:hypothetical protein WN51_09510 [Melipona quadrifasciata]